MAFKKEAFTATAHQMSPVNLALLFTLLIAAVVGAWAAIRHYLLVVEAEKIQKSKRELTLPVPQAGKAVLAKPVAVVTGGGGFLGQHIVEQLVRAGHYKTIRIFDMAGVAQTFKHASGVVVERFVGTLADENALARAFLGADAVFHAAALIDTRNGEAIMQRLWAANVHVSRQQCECADFF